MNQPLFSVIVTVYKVEEYIRQCVDSILNQLFRNFELILVNDGSPDGCPAICDEYAVKDKRVRVIHKENGGLSDARNSGFNIATGKYVVFVDGDDYIGEGSFESLYETLSTDGEVDVILLNVVKFIDCNGGTKKGKSNKMRYNNNLFKKERLYRKEKKEVILYLSSLSDFSWSPWLKLVRRELLVENKISFTTLFLGEDSDWSIHLYQHAETYNFCPGYLYHYRKSRPCSMTTSVSDKIVYDWIWVISKWNHELKKTVHGDLTCEFYGMMCFMYCMLLSMYSKSTEFVRQKYLPEIKKYSWLLKKSKDKRVLVLRLIYGILGLKATLFAYRMYDRLNKM